MNKLSFQSGNQNPTTQKKNFNIGICGDISLDYHIIIENELESSTIPQLLMKGHTYIQNGGVWFSCLLLKELQNQLFNEHINLVDMEIYPPKIKDNFQHYPIAFSIVSKFEGNIPDLQEVEGKTTDNKVLRISQYFARTNEKLNKKIIENYLPTNKVAKTIPDVLIVNEYNQEFQNNPLLWPVWFQPTYLFSSKKSSHSFCKLPPTFIRLCNPYISQEKDDINKNQFLENIVNYCQRLDISHKRNNNIVILTNISDLTGSDVFVRQGLSWESTGQALVKSFDNELKHLREVPFIVVVINRSGALLIENGQQFTLFYTTGEMEDDTESKKNGDMRGLNSGLLLNIVSEYIRAGGGDLKSEIIIKGIKVGLRNISSVYQRGFIEKKNYEIGNKLQQFVEEENNILPGFRIDDDDVQQKHEYPVKAMFAINSKNYESDLIDIEADHRTPSLITFRNKDDKWSILSANITEEPENIYFESLFNLVRNGESNFFKKNIPYLKFDELVIANNKEIEQYREIKKLINSYLLQREIRKPISIAIFGEPGTGKSFGIRNISDSITHRKPEKKEFNLSQFNGINDLINAFHLIRDSAIRGKIVLAQWDEFDCKFEGEDYGWVKYFLAPMQDGIFSYGGMAHPIGPSIFVFIGSKTSTLGELEVLIKPRPLNRLFNKLPGKPKRPTDLNGISKLQDFISRLQGHMDVPGLNPKPSTTDQELRELYLRRAIILRSMIMKQCTTIIKNENGFKVASIDRGLVNAFLKVKEYKYGARSMESIISMSHLDGRSRYNLSCLPSNDQLNLHVDVLDFLKHAY